MQLAGRTTCLYCELDGKTTPLVAHCGRLVCPIHSADWIAETTPKKPTPELTQKGQPGWVTR